MFRVGVVLSICADTRIKIHAALPKISLTTLLWPAIHFYIFQWFVRSSSTDFSGLTIIKISRENGTVPQHNTGCPNNSYIFEETRINHI